MNKYNTRVPKRIGIRRGQIITTFGPGALINLDNGSFIGMSIEAWPDDIKRIKGVVIYEERLQKRLRVSQFRQPPSTDEYPIGLPYRLFPRWLFCPNVNCRLLKVAEDWSSEYERKFIDEPLKCGKCKLQVVPMNFLVACRKGHIDDFPWVNWAHKNRPMCTKSSVLKYTQTPGAGLNSVRIKCMNCNASNTMQSAMGKDALQDKCVGSMPWAKFKRNEACGEPLKTVQRGSSNVYFSRLVSSIAIPPYTDDLVSKIHKTLGWDFISGVSGLSESTINETIKKISEEIQEPIEKVKKYIDIMLGTPDDNDEQTEDDYRYDEYQAFHGNFDPNTNDKKNFDIEEESADYSKYGIEKVILVKTLREVRTILGFTRLNPLNGDNTEVAETGENSTESVLMEVTEDNRKTLWRPGVEVRGEGIFITLNNGKLKSWANSDIVKQRLKELNKNLSNSSAYRNNTVRTINAKYVLLHTLAHLLISQLSFDCGYTTASLRERIYCNESDSSNDMNGILIYTAAGDEDGTLGGLVRQGISDRFYETLDNMIEKSLWCSNDPLCIESKGQGYESLNLAACYACTLLPETSCEEYNRFLDRGLLIGTPGNNKLGFFTDVLS